MISILQATSVQTPALVSRNSSTTTVRTKWDLNVFILDSRRVLVGTPSTFTST